MKTSTLKKNFILLVSLILSIYSNATNVVNVPTAGQLSSILTSEQKDTITVLKITGYLNSNPAGWGNSDFYTLRNMPNLQNLDLSETNITDNTIPQEAFYEKSSLKKVTLPASLQTINRFAFYNCRSLSSIGLPEGLQSINNSAFSGCTSFVGELLLPTTLKNIEDNAFYECTSITKVSLPASLESIGGYVFRNCTSLSEISFSEGLQTIGSYAFQNCSSISGVIILPSTLTKIDAYAFNNCYGINSCKINAVSPPTISSNTFGNIAVFYVPLGSASEYRNASYWSQKTIIDGDTPLTVTLDLSFAGTLGEEALKQVDHLTQIQKLIATGPLNNADWSQIKNMTSLVEVDLSATTATSIPNNQFENRSSLLKIKLPLGLTSIGNYAFYYCYGLQTIDIPINVESIGSRVFYECDALKSIILPESLTSLGESAFFGCNNLSSINIPSLITTVNSYTFSNCSKLETVILNNNITNIGSYAFQYCNALKSIHLPDLLTNLGSYAFRNCTSLTSVTFPETLETISAYCFHNCTTLNKVQLPSKLVTLSSYAFRYCPIDSITLPSTLMTLGYGAFDTQQLKKIICLQPTPPSLNDDPFYNVDKSTCELIVPFWAESSYKLANIWNQFLTVSTNNIEIDYLPVNGSLILSDNIRPLGNPSVEIFTTGDLRVRGNAPFQTDNFILRNNLNSYSFNSHTYSKLISESNNISAEDVKIDMSMYGNRWYYFVFPFDIAMSDISIDEDAFFVFRKYDGNIRAINGAGNSWVNIDPDEILRAGTGYIFQCSKSVNNLILKATELTKNNLFISDAWSIPLNTYASGNPADQSWNLIGNPYPSYFDIYHMDYTAPITVWNGNSYTAISPLDDDYILKPMEAFFIQKPTDLDAIVFNLNGRQISSEVETRSLKLRSSNSSRKLINLILSDQEFSDKSRIVINPDAELNYEIERDAAKFMSIDRTAPQLYSIDENNIYYAINERPVTDGIIPLGFYAGKEDEYNIALEEELADVEVILKDKLLEEEVNLTTTGYTFKTKEGSFDNRFELSLRINNFGTGITQDEISSINVYALNQSIIIENASGKQFEIYSISGKKITASILSNDSQIISISQGIYIVKVVDKVFKVAVF